mmetsp:Transcript_55969/g.64623  ORF Transcript_55969/g.64623 Transcript_55969/m.64623 type:complete len:99 (+) Transcript_55969:494-790(+)
MWYIHNRNQRRVFRLLAKGGYRRFSNQSQDVSRNFGIHVYCAMAKRKGICCRWTIHKWKKKVKDAAFVSIKKKLGVTCALDMKGFPHEKPLAGSSRSR